jgi:hypothetical protein
MAKKSGREKASRLPKTKAPSKIEHKASATPKRSKQQAMPTAKKRTKSAAPTFRAIDRQKDDKNSASQSQPLGGETETQPISLPQPTLDTLNDKDLIRVQTASQRMTGNLIYKDFFGDIERAVIYDPDFPQFVNSVQVAGKLYCTWDEVVLWSKWEGESREEYDSRAKKLGATSMDKRSELRTKYLSDPNNNESPDIIGDWSSEKRGPAHGPTYPFESPEEGQRIIALLKNWNFYAGTYQGTVGDRVSSVDNAVRFGEYASHGYSVEPFDFGEVRGWKPLEGERTSKLRPGPAKRWGFSEDLKRHESGWEGSGETIEDSWWDQREMRWQEEDDARYAIADARWQYQIGVFNDNWKDALDRTGRLRVVKDFLKDDAWWRSDSHFFWPQGSANAPEGKLSNFELFLNTTHDTVLREIRLDNELKRELNVQQSERNSSSMGKPKGVTRDLEEILVRGLEEEWNGHNGTPDFRFQAENGVWYWGYIPKEWLGEAPTNWDGPSMPMPLVAYDSLGEVYKPEHIWSYEPVELRNLHNAAISYYRIEPGKQTALPQSACELQIRALSIEAMSARIEEFQQLRDQYTVLVQSERSTRQKEARWRFLEQTTQEFLEDFLTELGAIDPESANEYIRKGLLNRTNEKIAEASKENSSERGVDAIDTNESVGPCNYTVGHLAILVKMTHGGVCKALREGRKIAGVKVKFIRNEGKRASYQIADKSYQAIERKMKVTD